MRDAFKHPKNDDAHVWRYAVIQKISQILIIADDLSGAADCTAGAVRAGLVTQVALGHELAESAVAHPVQVWSIDTDTRRLQPADAAKINAEILKRCRRPGQLLYKKIDSTLRGNFAAELLPMLAGSEMAVVAPAFPDAGRCTRNGHQYVNGVALEETEIWRNEGISGKADIPGRLSAHGIRTASLSLDQVRAGHAALRKSMEECIVQGTQAVVCDAETNEDLQQIAQASIPLSSSLFWVGSAGLANQLPDAAGLVGHAKPPKIEVKGAILTAVGSMSAISRKQMQNLSLS
ncbi:MAG: four-carbon acid sugar kinase family protein, partial [Burkholderiaceae bacterium]